MHDEFVLMSYYGPNEDNSWSERQMGMMEMVEKYSNMEEFLFLDMVHDSPGLQESLLKSIDEAEDGNVGLVTNLIAYAKGLDKYLSEVDSDYGSSSSTSSSDEECS